MNPISKVPIGMIDGDLITDVELSGSHLVLTSSTGSITNLDLATFATLMGLATTGYVDQKATDTQALINAGSTVVAINPTSPKDGDLIIVGSTVYVRVSGANQQIWPPLYQ